MTFATIRELLAEHKRKSAEARAERLKVLDAKWGLPIWVWLALLFVLGLGVRLASFHYARGFYHPDETSQYLEPAHRLLERHWMVTWEFRDGGRNWFVAWHCSSIMQFARWLGLSGLAHLRLIRLNDAILSLVVIPAAFRIGRAVGGRLESGVLAAALTALAPMLGYFGCCIMAEWHCFIFLTWAYAIWCEHAHSSTTAQDTRPALMVGLLLGFAFDARPNYGVVIPLIVADYLLRKRYRELFALLCGLTVAVAALGIADFATWGAPFKSIVVWVDFNIIQGRGAASNLHPIDFYFRDVLYGGYGPALAIIIVAMLLSLRVTWRAVLGWVWPMLVMSMLTNKQERFLLPIWPCFLSATAASLVETRELLFKKAPAFTRSRALKWVALSVPLLVMALALISNLSAARRAQWREKATLLEAQNWVRKQQDLTGLAITSRWYRSGAYTVTDRHIPLVFDQNEPPAARIYSHFIATGDAAERAAESGNWGLLRTFGRYKVYRRHDAWIRSFGATE